MNKEKIFGLLRHILGFAGGIAVGRGLIDEGTAQELVGAIMLIVSFAASWMAPEKNGNRG